VALVIAHKTELEFFYHKVALHMHNTSMDAMLFVHKNTNNPMYVDLLDEWNQFSNDEINKWLADEMFDKYDRQNLWMS